MIRITVPSLSHLGGAELWLGRWEGARTQYTRARAMADSVGNGRMRPISTAGSPIERCDRRLRRSRTPRRAWPGSGRTDVVICEAIMFLERELAEVNIEWSRPGRGPRPLLARAHSTRRRPSFCAVDSAGARRGASCSRGVRACEQRREPRHYSVLRE